MQTESDSLIAPWHDEIYAPRPLSVRGAGVRIMATDPDRHTHLPWEFHA